VPLLADYSVRVLGDLNYPPGAPPVGWRFLRCGHTFRISVRNSQVFQIRVLPVFPPSLPRRCVFLFYVKNAWPTVNVSLCQFSAIRGAVEFPDFDLPH